MNKNEEIRKQIIEKLVKTRKQKHISQSELAKLMNIKASNLSRIESGEQNITLDTFLDYCNFIGNDPVDMVAETSFVYHADNVEYCLKIYDDVLIEFEYPDNDNVKITKINNDLIHLLPLGLELNDKSLLKWLKTRTIPSNRMYVEEILKTYGLNLDDKKAIIDVCLGLSLNDSYWVVPKDFDGKFERFNLYDNPLDEIIEFVAYTGHVYTNNNKKYTTSPEFTTGGMFRKTWHRDNDGILYLYKTGTEGFSNSGLEPYSENMAYQIGERMGLDCVKYDLVKYKGYTATKCEIFTNIDTSYVPIGKIVTSGGIEACVDYYDSMGNEFPNAIRSMLIFDALIYNEDRHFGNFGVLRDNKTGEIVAPAPLFDHGLSLFCYATKDRYEEDNGFKKYALTRTTPYGLTFNEIARKYITTYQKTQLRRLINFKFKGINKEQFDSKRLELIEQHLQNRIQELLNM